MVGYWKHTGYQCIGFDGCPHGAVYERGGYRFCDWQKFVDTHGIPVEELDTIYHLGSVGKLEGRVTCWHPSERVLLESV